MRNLLLTLIFGLLAFTGFSQIQLVGNITTFGGGSYPTHIDSLGYGGLTVVADATERDAITQLRRKVGMIVFQVDESQLYYLDAPITENNWIPIESGTTNPDTTATTIYCPAHGLDLTDYEGDFLPMFACRGAQADHLDSLQTYYAVSIPDTDSITIIASGLIYRPNHDLADFIGKIVYLTNTVGAYDTIQGTVLSAIAVVIDSNYIDLLPRSVLESDRALSVLILPASFLNAYLGDAKVPQDTAVQRLARLYASVGLLRAGGKVITQTTAISDNPVYGSAGSNPVNPAMSWTWTGGTNGRVIKDKEMLVSVDLEDTAYGGLDITPLDPVVLVDGIPTDTTVFNWLEDNVTNNKLRLPNGSLLYFVGDGSRQNPDYIWTVMDDLSGNLSGTTRWSRLIKRVKEPAQSLDNPVIGTGTAGRFAGWASTDSLTNFPLLFGTGAVTLDAGLGFQITGGTTASRPTGAAGMMYWNTSNGWWDYHNGTAWFNPARSATTNGLFTAGSWLFAASDGTVTQNNSNFFVDNSNIRVGIGTNTPALTLDVRSASANTTAVQSIANSIVTTPLKTFATNATPESAITGSPGDVAFSNTGTAYVKETGSATNTGWKKISTATDLATNNGIISALPLGNVTISSANYLKLGLPGQQAWYSGEGIYGADELFFYSNSTMYIEVDQDLQILADEQIDIQGDYISYRNNSLLAGAIFRMREANNNGINYVSVEAPPALSANTKFAYPTTNGTSGYVLQSDGTGITSWQPDANGLISALPLANTDIETDYTLGLEDSGGERLELNSLGLNIVSIADDASLNFTATGIDFISGSGAAFGISSQESFSLNTTNDNINFNAGSGLFQVTASTINMTGTLNANSTLAVTGAATFRGASGAAGTVTIAEPIASGTNTHTLTVGAMAANMVTYLPTSAPTTENGVWERDAAGNTILRATVHSSISGSTDGSGDITVSHDNDDGTFNVQVTVTGTTFFHAQVHSKNGTDFKIRFFDAAGAAVTGTAVTADYTLTDI